MNQYMNIQRIEFVVTYQCSGKCRHCSVGDRLNQSSSKKHVDKEKAVEAIAALSRLYDISSVMTFGGEPLLYADTVCAIHKKASECGIGKRQLITNGYFTQNDAKRKEVASQLTLADVNEILLSVDAFHQEYIPYDAVHRFAAYILEANLSRSASGPGLRLHPAWVVNEQHENIHNTETRALLSKFADLELPVSNGNNIFMAGNAQEHLADYYEKPSLDLSQTCGSMPYTSPLTEISSLSIVPNGDVTVCHFAIGNIYTEDITEILSRYDPYEDAFMRAAMEGAPALLAYAEALGLLIDPSSFYSVCDVCHAVGQLAKKKLGETK